MKCISGGECYEGKYCQCVGCRRYEIINLKKRFEKLTFLEEEILAALKNEGLRSTWKIGQMLKVHTSTARRALKKMEAAGLVKRHYLSTRNNILDARMKI